MVKEMSAEELEEPGSRCIRMEVTDITVLARVLDSMDLEYKIISETVAEIFSKANITQLTVALAEENCEVISIKEKDESLESYYISLIGGDDKTRRLLRAGFYRVKSRKLIRIELLTAMLISIFIILNGFFETNLTNAYVYKLVARFFGYAPLMGPFIAVFTAFLWGTDYEYGTLRNKLICGHTREEVYFSNLLMTICAGGGIALVWLAVNEIWGIPLLGDPERETLPGESWYAILWQAC